MEESTQKEIIQEENNPDIPADIMSLVGIASSFSEEDIMNDDKLSYLLQDIEEAKAGKYAGKIDMNSFETFMDSINSIDI